MTVNVNEFVVFFESGLVGVSLLTAGRYFADGRSNFGWAWCCAAGVAFTAAAIIVVSALALKK